jgi:threonine aldolase
MFDTVSICLSKGLGAPVGSVLTGSKEHIARAKRIRKVLGGTMRQAGYLAAAGIYALENNVKRLSIDHLHAKAIAVALKKTSWVKSVMDVDTNIIIFELADGLYSNDIIKELVKKDILASSPTSKTIRLVTHLDITTEMVEHVLEVIGSLDPGSKR